MTRLLTATLLAASLGAGTALAQANAPAGAPPGGGGGANVAGAGGAGGGDSSGGGTTPGGPGGTEQAMAQAPVAYVTNVEVVHLQRANIDLVHVQGVVTTINWGAGVLVPLIRGTPSDGMLDLQLLAPGPTGTQLPSAYYPVDAWLQLKDAPYKGVRVRGAFNALELKEMPGYAEAKAPGVDWTNIVGKKFVAHGASGGSGDIRADDLPPGTKVIMPTDGINDQTRDPNRLTIYVGDDGKVLDAYWN